MGSPIPPMSLGQDVTICAIAAFPLPAPAPAPAPAPSQQRDKTSTSCESPQRHLPPSEVPCKFFNRGFCNRGASCWFKHDVNLFLQHPPDSVHALDLRDVPKEGLSVAAVGIKDSKDNRAITSDLLNDENAGPEICSICFEVPELYGILESCDHVFCLECIRSWRSSASGEQNGPKDPSKASKTCPCCRISSKFIIPSSVFPSTSHDESEAEKSKATKKVIVSNYLSQMRRIPCKYFQESIKSTTTSTNSFGKPSCPFANKCHYAHIDPVTGEHHIFNDSELRGIRRRASRARQVRNGVRRDALHALMWDDLPMALRAGSQVSISYETDDILGWITGEDLGYFDLGDELSVLDDDI